MSTGYDAAGLVKGARDYVRPRGPRLRELPPPEETWQAADIPKAAVKCLQRLRHLGVIEIVGQDEEARNRYRTTRNGWKVIQEYAEREDALLCEHGGIKNLGDGLYTCGDDECDHRYTRDTVELLMLEDTLS